MTADAFPMPCCQGTCIRTSASSGRSAGSACPYIVAGAGGYANTPKLMHAIEKTASGRPLPHGFRTTHADLRLMMFNDSDPGFLRVSVDGKARKLALDYFLVPFSGAPSGKTVDSVLVDW
jgi:hypothetical protein